MGREVLRHKVTEDEVLFLRNNMRSNKCMAGWKEMDEEKMNIGDNEREEVMGRVKKHRERECKDAGTQTECEVESFSWKVKRRKMVRVGSGNEVDGNNASQSLVEESGDKSRESVSEGDDDSGQMSDVQREQSESKLSDATEASVQRRKERGGSWSEIVSHPKEQQEKSIEVVAHPKDKQEKPIEVVCKTQGMTV